MIRSIVDNRTRRYRWKSVEAFENGNSCKGADQAPSGGTLGVVHYDALEAVSVNGAVTWAMKQPCPVTLYLYDDHGGFPDDEHFG